MNIAIYIAEVNDAFSDTVFIPFGMPAYGDRIKHKGMYYTVKRITWETTNDGQIMPIGLIVEETRL